MPQLPAATASGTITGVVTNTGGVPIAGAALTLSPANGAEQATFSGPDGTYTFANVPPGPFRLSATLPGFNPTPFTGTLATAQHLQVPAFALRLATVTFTVDAVLTPADAAEVQLRAEEHQRLIGFIPNFFVSYDWHAPPLTARQKFRLAFKNASDPGNLLLVGTVAGVQQADNAFPGYGQGAAGYGRRYGADLGNLAAGTMMGGAVLPALFHQDPRYFYKGTGTIRSRFLYALSTAVICRGDNGHRQPAWAGVLGDLSAGAISNLYYPASDRQGATLFLENGVLGIAGDAMNNVFQEFFLRKLSAKTEKHNAKPQP